MSHLNAAPYRTTGESEHAGAAPAGALGRTAADPSSAPAEQDRAVRATAGTDEAAAGDGPPTAAGPVSRPDPSAVAEADAVVVLLECRGSARHRAGPRLPLVIAAVVTPTPAAPRPSG